MQKQFLLIITSCALLSGCGNKENKVAEPKHSISPIAALNVADTTVQAQTSTNPPKPSEIKSHPGSATASDLSSLIIGEKVYKSTCSICHKSGLNGAPRMGSKKDWEQRLAQGNQVLYDRAINGYRGSKGSMPSRGSNPKLSEGEVKAAVDYMIEYSIPSWSVE